MIKFVDLQRQYHSIKSEIDKVVKDVLESSSFVLGPFTEEFEKSFAKLHNAKYCITVSSGTSALYLILKALKIGRGDKVIVPVNTFIATVEAVSLNGAKPVFVDIDEKTYNIAPELVENYITTKTKAIIPVHLYGQPAEMDNLIKIAKKYNLYLVEDACQAHMAQYKGKKVGTFGIAAAFSFYPSKNLGAYGEGGAIITNNYELAEKIRMLRDHGSKQKYYHEIIGGNFRMSALQAAILSVKLKHLKEWTEKRRRIAYLYNQLLSEVDSIITPYELPYVKHVYHLYVVRLDKKRNEIRKKLLDMNIQTGIHYPIPLHLQKTCQFLGYKKGTFIVAEKYVRQILSLPIYPELKEEEVELIVSKLIKSLKET
ncbi:MAG TPA: DegT/DnrJ/EryC1/StrS family aminotransferase [Candidatus Atribacteria bacterium]|nr:DegT/DnrJ/EryC1/StrS family aminotransferase [Candidatus Atribacteria bacterium]